MASLQLSFFSSGSNNPTDSSFKNQITGKKFEEMVRSTPYRVLLKASCTYEIYIDRRTYHRRLLVKMKRATYPLITLEITTSDMSTLTQVMCTAFNGFIDGIERVGDCSKRLITICRIADDVVSRMKSYRLFSNNCQHFCNNVLQELELETFDVTTWLVSNKTSIDKSSHNNWEYRDDAKESTATTTKSHSRAGFFQKTTAHVVGKIVGAPTLNNQSSTIPSSPLPSAEDDSSENAI